MESLFNLIGVLIIGSIVIGLNLLPYYIAYVLISPESFMGIVGVFIVGSVIIPLTISVTLGTLQGLASRKY